MDDLDPRIDALYAGPPALFTKARDALARELAAEGDRAGAAAARTLRRPSALAAELNRLAREDPGRLAAMMEAQDLLAAAQRRMLEGSGDAGGLRDAERAESAAVGAFPGGPPVHAALRFAARSPALREELRRGVLSRDPVPGDDGGGPFSFGPPPPDAGVTAPAPAPRDELAEARAKRAARAAGAGAGDAAAAAAEAAERQARARRDAERAETLRAVTAALDEARAAERAAAGAREEALPRAEEAMGAREAAVAERERLRGKLAAAEERAAAAEDAYARADAALSAARAAADAARAAREAAERTAREALEEASRD